MMPAAGALAPHDFHQIVAQARRRLQPPIEPTRQVGHAVGLRKAQPLGQLPKRRHSVAAAEPGRDRPGQVGVMTTQQRRAVQTVEFSHRGEDPVR